MVFSPQAFRDGFARTDTELSFVDKEIIMDSNQQDLIAQFSGITGASPETVSLE